MSFEITNYDVLLRRDVNGHCTVLDSDHVGNRRFTVLLDIHRERYCLARQGRDTTECERIVDKIINTVCNECVPNGRFLEKVSHSRMSEGGVRQLFPPEIKLTLHLSLGGAPLEPSLPQLPPLPSAAAVYAEISRRRQLLQRSISESMINFPPPLDRNNFHRSLSVNNDTYAPIHPLPVPSNDAYMYTQPHRHTLPPEFLGSHLSLPTPVEEPSMRRSFPAVVDRRAAAQQTASLWTSAPNLNMAPPAPAPPQFQIIHDTCMDVVFERDYESISSSTHAGNNRFRILIDLQCNTFRDAGRDIQEKERIVDDIVRSVESWNGRFLLETSNEYEPMTLFQAKECIRAILVKQSLRQKEIEGLKARKQKKESMRLLSKQQSDSNFNYRGGDGDDDMMMM